MRPLLRVSLAAAGCAVACQSPTADMEPPASMPEFTLTVSPATQTIAPGSATQFNVDIVFVNDFTSTAIDLSVLALAAGMSVDFDPNPLPHQGRSVLTVAADANVAPDQYTLTVRAEAEGIVHTDGFDLEITAEPTFAISVSPTTQNVAAGQNAVFDVTVTAMNGFASAVAVTVAGVPADATVSYSENPVVPPGTTSVTVATEGGTTPATYDLVFGASADGMDREIGAALNVTTPGSTWGIAPVGATGASNNCVLVGPARNDGTNRIYVGTVTTGRILEFTRTGDDWAMQDIGGSPADEEIHNMGFGPGRDDGALRIYAGSLDGELYELSWNGSAWTQTTVGTSVGGVTHAVVGDGRDDGVNRVYATRGTAVWEYTWNGAGWDALEVGSATGGGTHGIVMGDGRGDGLPRLYVASTGGGVYEGTFAAGAWSLVSIASTGDTRNVGVGHGRNDGVPRIYAARANGVMTEISWTGGGWTTADLGASLGVVLVHAYVLDGRGDGVNRVYTSAQNGNSYEFTRNGNAWSTEVLGGGSDYMYGLHYGAGRNDGVVRLYGASFNTQVYEYSWQ